MSGGSRIPDSVRAAIAVPDLVSSPLGDLHFFDGVPSLESVETIYDLLFLVRGIEVYLNTIPGASLMAMRTGFRSVGVDGTAVLGYTAPRANSGSFFLTANTADGRWLDGGQTYQLTLPADIPAKNFWSLDLYDTQTRSLLETGNPYPAVMSLGGTVQANDDSSTTVYFGPTAPDGKQSNWVQTVPGKSWFTILRLYGPLQPWFDKTWRPGEIEPLTA